MLQTTMAARRSSSLFLLAFYLCLYSSLVVVFVHLPCASSLSFSFNFSETGDPCGNKLVCKGGAFFSNSMIELTRNDRLIGRVNSLGRVLYPTPVPLWDAATGEVTSFTTAFTFKITKDPTSKIWGDGMTFFLAAFSSNNSVLDQGIGGGFLGLFDYSNYLGATDGGGSQSQQVVAVEFDTFLNDGWESSDQHVGIDVNSIKSVASVNTSSPGIKNRKSDSTMDAKINYDNVTKLLTVHLQIDNASYSVNATVDLSKSLPEEVAVGFTAATGAVAELHRILSWSFYSTLDGRKRAPIAMPPAPASQPLPIPSIIKSRPSATLLLKILVPVAFVSVSAVVGLLWQRQKHRRNVHGQQAINNNNESDEEHDMADELEKGVAGPRRYLYHELASATDNFAEENKLGQGGFGSVYKGRLSDDENGQQVAIKKFSLESSQGRKEFEAEVKIISRLRHRNLVLLLGWCDSPKGLLLVYELVSQGSLDEHIHDNERLLTWQERYNIILGLGSALRYLHLDWEQCVVHGDIKPSNIMLDSSHNAKLGDFGLARLVDHGTGPQTTGLVQGTVGYIDPEFVSTFQRSTQSDVYSFGIVLLVIVSGRQPVNRLEPSFRLPKWVWNLYSQDLTLEAVDARLRGDGDDDDDASEQQMERALVVGLWCAHPDPAERPSMAQAMHALQSEDARLPALSSQMYRQQFVAPPSFGAGESGASGNSLSSGVRSSSATTRVTSSPE